MHNIKLAQFSFPKRRLFYHELVSRIAYHKQLRSQEMFVGGVVYVVIIKPVGSYFMPLRSSARR